MALKSRAAMENGKDMEINSIWLGFFRPDGSLAKRFTYGTQSPIGSSDHDFNTLDNIQINSGKYYIAAVANVTGNRGVLYRGDGSGVTTPTTLLTLLNREDLTYEDFRNIAFFRGATDASTGPIDTPTGNLPMHGVYLPDANEPHPISPDRLDELANTYVYIAPTSGSVAQKLDGHIHFRRLVAQNKFNISYNTSIIKEFEVVSARVYNVPLVAWIAERGDFHKSASIEGMDDTNAGDYTGILGRTASESTAQASAKPNYPNSANIQQADIVKNSSGSYSFDWWQLENRRQALPGTNSYAMREHERKDSDGRNTGIYTSLTGESGEVTANNLATYVQIRVRMEMKDTPANQITSTSQMTSVDAVYTIHLGYCNGADGATKALDFNCNRNTKYTYNVNIAGVNKIIVEAQREDVDYEHGAEGTVTFVTTQYFEADAHYSAFNIALSNVERAEANWIVRVYTDPDNFIDINNSNYKDFDEKYYNWIEFRPTSGANIIAPYKPIGGVTTATSTNPKTFSLADLANLKDYPAYGLNSSTTSIQTRYYTVFINEYVYENSYNSNVSPNWPKYVNLPPRTFWLKVLKSFSDDHESVIISSKYAFRQKSIQSLLDTSNPVSGIVIGMEHINELSGIPLKMHGSGMQSSNNNGSTPTGNDASQRNYNYFANGNGASIGSSNNSRRLWNTYLQNYSSSAVPMKNASGDPNGLIDIRNLGSFTSYYSGSSHYYSSSRSVAEACLNRNRDLNGNGTIDQNEIRWIVPDISQYLQLVTGSASFSQPLINFNDFGSKAPWSSETDYYTKSLYHFGSIDSNQLWAEEGVSTGWLANKECSNPQEVRCIRYLGNDYSKFPSSSDFSHAVQKVDGSNMLRFIYSAESIRSASSDALPVHRVREAGNWNRPPSLLEYKGKSDDFTLSSIRLPDGNYYKETYTFDNSGWFSYLGKYNPCDKFNTSGETGWRVPNQVEILALLDNGLLESGDYLTSTMEYFDPGRVMGADTSHGYAFNAGSSSYIKCVRDVE